MECGLQPVTVRSQGFPTGVDTAELHRRVAMQCVHQHDAPFVCLRGQKLVAEQQDGLSVVRIDFFNDCLSRARAAVKDALPKARPVSHVARGEARVEKVASNRRVAFGPDGKVRKMRGSGCRDPELIALPEGLIDPMLKTVAFYDGPEKIVACHYYATHPMSHYGRGHVSSDFVGLARKQRQQEEPDCPQPRKLTPRVATRSAWPTVRTPWML